MRSDLRYLPIRFPSTLGRCSQLYQPSTGKALLYVRSAWTFDPQTDERIADCISWVVEQFGITDLAFDGWTMPTGVTVKEGGRFFAVQPDGTEQFIPRVRDHLRQRLGPEDRFLLRGWFQGTIHKVDNTEYYTRHVEALMRLHPYRTDLVREFERTRVATYEQAPEFLDARCLALLRNRGQKDYGDFGFLSALAATAESIGIDLSRFPLMQLIQKLQGNGLMMEDLEEAVPDVERLFEKLAPRLPPGLYEDLESLYRECNEAGQHRDNDAVADRWQWLVLQLKEYALGYGLGLGDYPAFEAVLEKVEGFYTLVYVPDTETNLQREARRLFLTLVERSSHPERGRLFVDTLDTIQTMQKLCEVKLSPAEYQDALARGADSSFIHKLSQLHISWNLPPQTLDTVLELAQDSCYLALARARYIAAAVTQWLDTPDDRKDKILLLKTAGFLASTICNELDPTRIACYLITPKLTLPQEIDAGELVERLYQDLYQSYHGAYGL